MRRNRARTVVCVAAALLVGLTLGGCNRHGASPAPTTTRAGATSTAGGGASSAPGGGPTMDPVASELDQIDQLINDINNSVNSSDASPDDGE